LFAASHGTNDADGVAAEAFAATVSQIADCDAFGRGGLAATGAGAVELTKDDFKGRAKDGIFGAEKVASEDLRRTSLPLLLLLLPDEDDDDPAEGFPAAGTSLLLLPVELVVLMLLALISDRPAAVPEPGAGTFFAADDRVAVPEFSFADAASFAFFCCSQDCNSSSRDVFLFLGCMIIVERPCKKGICFRIGGCQSSIS
jgi:hypothetical protein